MSIDIEKTASLPNKDSYLPAGTPEYPDMDSSELKNLVKVAHPTLSLAPLEARKALLLKWVPILYRGGATPPFAQSHIDRLSKLLKLSLTTTFLPGRVLITWGDEEKNNLSWVGGSYQQNLVFTLLVRWGFNMEMLERMDHLLDALEEQTKVFHDINSLHKELDEISTKAPIFANWIVVLAFGVLSGTMAPAFFSGHWLDGIMAFILGAYAGLLVILCDYFPTSFLYMHELASSFSVSLLTLILIHIRPDLSYWPIVLAATIWILPGFSMVIGIMDVTLKFPMTGFITHLNAAFVGLTMAFGYALSIWILRTLNVFSSFPALYLTAELKDQPPFYVVLLLCGAFSIACAAVFQSPPRQWPTVIIGVCYCITICTYMTSFNEWPISDEVQCFLIATFLGIFVRLCAKIVHQVPEATLYVAMLPLVPGSRFVKSCFALLYKIHNIDCTMPSFKPVYNSTFICIAVAFGLVLAQVLFDYVALKLLAPLVGSLMKRITKKKFFSE